MDLTDLLFPTTKVLPKPKKNKSVKQPVDNASRSRQLLKPEQHGPNRGSSVPPENHEKSSPQSSNGAKRSKSKEENKREFVIKPASPKRSPVPLTPIE